MRKNPVAIAVAAAILAVAGLTVTKSENATPAARAETHMPSILDMMSNAVDLPFTPLVSP